MTLILRVLKSAYIRHLSGGPRRLLKRLPLLLWIRRLNYLDIRTTGAANLHLWKTFEIPLIGISSLAISSLVVSAALLALRYMYRSGTDCLMVGLAVFFLLSLSGESFVYTSGETLRFYPGWRENACLYLILVLAEVMSVNTCSKM